jgi:manganese/zinc/iron transport system ATP- binding protein
MTENVEENEIAALDVFHLTVSYGHTPVLWDISLSVPKGNLVGIIGPNGAGKSTFIKACLNLIHPLSGKVEFFGNSLQKIQKKVAYVPQRESVDWDFPITVRELVVMGRFGELGIFRWPRKADLSAADRYLKMVGMEGYADRQISQLSGGQQQRIFLARALLQDADLYFLDEPFAGIDIASEKVIVDLLRLLRDRKKTIFVVHHDLNSAKSYFDWVMLLNLRLIACGPLKEVFTSENLNIAYGKNYVLFDEALKISETKWTGLS